MNINDIHFIREILVSDFRGNEIPTMQTSEANASCLHPIFKEVAFYDRDPVRALYQELGGGRREGAQWGSTVIIPNRSRWANLRRITADEVQIIASPDSPELSSEELTVRNEQARARNRLMRD